MINEGESSQISRLEYEEQQIEIEPTKPHNGRKISKFLLLPNDKMQRHGAKRITDGSVTIQSIGQSIEQLAKQLAKQS
ncbi:hypothetical protein F8M41_008445 [Gigaspora margarita]|uniref:Uncharacterized protein n=1 Tax=Gigaspora margarita TaxID=4874 RepID=A0A8H4AVL2_GIGMA|nr:hypothetical protein F8M41_008445 [Gigaspora margarita]